MAKNKAEQLLDEQRANMSQSIAKGGAASAGSSMIPKAREVPAREQGVSRATDAFEIEIDRIVPDPEQPRREFDEQKIQDMAASLLSRGQKQPISVRFSPSLGKWMIVSGERRYRGAKLAGLKTLKAIEYKGSLDRGDLLMDQLIENLQRDDLSALDKAHSFREMMELNHWSGNQLAKELNIAQPVVVEALALLSMPEDLKEKVRLEEIPSSTAYEIAKVKDPEAQKQLADEVVSEGLNRNETRERAKQVKQSSAKGRGGKVAARPPKPWKLKLPNGVKVMIEYGKVIDRKEGYPALIEAAEKFRQEHPEAVA